MALSIATNAATLTAKEAAIVDIGEATARGEQDKLAEAFKAGFDAGLTLNEAKEIVGQLYAYCGFPRALNAAATLMSAWGTGNQEWGTGKSPTPFESDYNALRSGTANQTKLCETSLKSLKRMSRRIETLLSVVSSAISVSSFTSNTLYRTKLSMSSLLTMAYHNMTLSYIHPPLVGNAM